MAKVIDKGHYVEVPVPQGAERIFAGCPASKVLNVTGGAVSAAFVVEKDARLDLCFVMLPQADAQVDVTIDFVGEGAEVSLSGLYVCRKGVKLSLRVLVRHRAGNTISRQMFKGIVADGAVSSFDGRIVVAPDAQKIKALQENHNILLSEDARVETRPQLEIYADDVECSHGATVGALNQDEQFYMCSRGIPAEEARVLQMISFLSPVIDCAGSGRARAALRRKVSALVRHL